jgi:hypothetical protein
MEHRVGWFSSAKLMCGAMRCEMSWKLQYSRNAHTPTRGKFGWDEVNAQQVLLYERVGARDSAVDAFRATSALKGTPK